MRKVKIIIGNMEGKVGWFHDFFTYADEYGSGAEAIIEFEDGSCKLFSCERFKFLDQRKIMSDDELMSRERCPEDSESLTCPVNGCKCKIIWNQVGTDIYIYRCDNCGYQWKQYESF